MLRSSASSCTHSANVAAADAAGCSPRPSARRSAAGSSLPACTAARAIRLTQSRALVANGPAGSSGSTPKASGDDADDAVAHVRRQRLHELGGRRPADGVVDDDQRRLAAREQAGDLAELGEHARALLAVGDDDDDAGVALAELGRLVGEALVVGGEAGTRDRSAPGRATGGRRSWPRPAAGRRRRRGRSPRRSGPRSARRTGRSPRPAASRSARCGRTAPTTGSRRGRAPSPSASTSARRPRAGRRAWRGRRSTRPGRRRRRRRARSARRSPRCAVVALLPSSKPSTSSTGCPSTPPAALICSTAAPGRVDQRLADRRPLAGLRQQQADPQDAVVEPRPAPSSS